MLFFLRPGSQLSELCSFISTTQKCHGYLGSVTLDLSSTRNEFSCGTKLANGVSMLTDQHYDLCQKLDGVNSRLGPSQWETSLQSNAVSHRLGGNQESALFKVMSYDEDYICVHEDEIPQNSSGELTKCSNERMSNLQAMPNNLLHMHLLFTDRSTAYVFNLINWGWFSALLNFHFWLSFWVLLNMSCMGILKQKH